MEVSNVDKRSFLVNFNRTENIFINELAAAGDCKLEKIIADLMFKAILYAHEKLRYDEMMKQHDQYWDR